MRCIPFFASELIAVGVRRCRRIAYPRRVENDSETAARQVVDRRHHPKGVGPHKQK